MIHPPFNPSMPTGYHYAVKSVHWSGKAHIVFYDVWSDAGYEEQRCACITVRGVKWDQIIWAHQGPEFVKEFRAQKVERVRLKAYRRRHW